MPQRFSAPAYPGGQPAPKLYHCGPMTADDRSGFTPEDSLTLLVTDTCREEFEAYLALCRQQGYRLSFRSGTGSVEAAQLIRAGCFLFVSFNPRTGEVRITQDFKTCDLSSFSDPVSTGESALIVQYGLYYDENNDCTDHSMNCGMFYIVRLCDRRLFLIDGGHEYQFSEAALQGLHEFLRELTGAREGEAVEIAGWYFSHAHSDHMAALPRLLRRYPGQYHIQRLLFNFPSMQSAPDGYDPEIAILKEAIRELCPQVPCLKLHGGQSFQLANASFEVLYTHEEAITMESPDRFPLEDFNSTSTLLKMTIDGGSVLWLGDGTRELENLLVRTTTASIWKADVVQVAHHCINYLPKLYRLIGADWALVPNSRKNAHTKTRLPNLRCVEDSLSDAEHVCYEDETTLLRFCAGRLTPLDRRPLIGAEYDGTDLYGNHRP